LRVFVDSLDDIRRHVQGEHFGGHEEYF
jgi:hypothetical protein